MTSELHPAHHILFDAFSAFLSEEGEDRVKDAYTQSTWERLVRLKDKYDPDNMFSLNQNIKPSS